MLLSLLLLLLLVYSTQATNFYGTVITYYPKNTNASGFIKVVLRFKLNFQSCTDVSTWTCFIGNCGNESTILQKVDEERSSEWCQIEAISSQQLLSNTPIQLQFDGGNWTDNIDGIVFSRAVTLVELRNRSDTGQANRSPQTTILPALRVPSNCQRNFNLLAFDPDGDEVKCRYGNTTEEECNPCTPPSVLSLSSTCTLSFSSTSSNNEGSYAVQLVMEDFPRQQITLFQTSGSQVVKTINDPISKIPVQFVLRVDPVVPSCTEGLYLPKFLPPTPANRAQLYIPVSRTLEISIKAEANNSIFSELLFSGPHSIKETSSGAGQFVLRWTPSEDKDGESHPICFVVQASTDTNKYHSELRCVIVTVGNDPTATTTIPPTTTHQLLNNAPTNTTQATTMSTPIITTPTQSTTMTTTPPTTTTTITPTTASTPTATSTSTMQSTAIINMTITYNITATPTTTTLTSPTSTPSSTTVASTTTNASPPISTTPDDTTPVTEELNSIVVALKMRLSSSSPLSEEELRTTVIQQLKDELVRQGLPSDITLRLVSSVQLEPKPQEPKPQEPSR